MPKKQLLAMKKTIEILRTKVAKHKTAEESMTALKDFLEKDNTSEASDGAVGNNENPEDYISPAAKENSIKRTNNADTFYASLPLVISPKAKEIITSRSKRYKKLVLNFDNGTICVSNRKRLVKIGQIITNDQPKNKDKKTKNEYGYYLDINDDKKNNLLLSIHYPDLKNRSITKDTKYQGDIQNELSSFRQEIFLRKYRSYAIEKDNEAKKSKEE